MVSRIKSNIVLNGLPGSGKSTVGQILASRLHMAFIDTDRLVEETSGECIPDIFSKYGEPRFRELEAAAIRQASQLRNVVISIGGGAIMRRENYHALRETGTILWLNASIETLLKRLEGDSSRPLLVPPPGLTKADMLRSLANARQQVYTETADLIVDADADPRQVADEVMRGLQLTDAPSWELQPESVPVRTRAGRYEVKVGCGFLVRELVELCRELPNVSKLVIVSNPLVNQLHASVIGTRLCEAGFRTELVLVGDGESHKTLETAFKLYDQFVRMGVDRDSVVVAVGGGVTGDVAGFVAATFMRGIRWLQVPTTLLAQVDASVGGKVAVDHPAGKNLIGAFHQPVGVVSDIAAIITLPDRAFAEGMAEAIKTAIIDGQLFQFIETHAHRVAARDPWVTTRMVAACARVKSQLVGDDELDRGPRMLLNLGHTFGHAMEAALGYSGISHGEAVAVGTCIACRLAERIGVAERGLSERVSELMRTFGLPTCPAELRVCPSPESTLMHMFRDKKSSSGRLRLVIPFAIGDVRVLGDVPNDIIKETFRLEWEANSVEQVPRHTRSQP
ncbi:MAG: 3-dehydroquinate synthase [Bacillota bacterium]